MITKPELIADLKRVAEKVGESNVNRRMYREHGAFTSWDVESLFGSFTEFRREAGLLPTMHQRQVLSAISKHASMDEMRKLNIDRADFGDKYRKPSGKRFQTVIVASDLHDTNMDPFWRRVFIDSIRRIKPEIICLGGDVFDLPEFGKYPVDPRTWDVVGRMRAVHAFLGELREASPDSEIVMIEGNHEFRLLRHLAEASPAIRAVLSDLHGMTVSGLLGLDKYEVRYVARGDLAVWTRGDINQQIARNYEVFFETLLVDHFPDGINKGLSGYNGHHHKFNAISFYNELRGPQIWMQLGCGHVCEAEYTDGQRWNMGFAINHIDTSAHRVAMNYVPVTRDFAEVGGTFYYREDSER